MKRLVLGLLACLLAVGTAHAQLKFPYWLAPYDSSQLPGVINSLANDANQTFANQSLSNAALPGARGNLLPAANTNIIYATDAKGAVSGALCTWDGGTGHDVGDCINGAIAQAAANGGGTVIVPAGLFYFSTLISNTTSGVNLSAAGWGVGRDTSTSSHFLSVTRLLYNGSPGAGPGYYDGIGAGSQTLYGAGIQGITFDCGNLLNTCVHVQQVANSWFYLGQAEAVKTGMLFDGVNVDTYGVQNDDLWLETRNLGASNTSTASGVVFDRVAGSPFDFSLNRVHYIHASHAGGDGIVFCEADTNLIEDITAYRYGTATTGSPIVAASSGYVPPSGVACNGQAFNNEFVKAGSPIYFAGGNNGLTFVASGGNMGTGALNPITLTTNAPTSAPSSVLNFASTTGVSANEAVTCGGASSGVYPYSIVKSVGGSTVTLFTGTVNAGGSSGVANGQSCTFTLGVTSYAVSGGTYTLTANSATNFTLTAPAGGHTQTLNIASGMLNFIDMNIPFTGTANANDNWTITVPTASFLNEVKFVDKANAVSDPFFESNATGVTPIGNSRSLYYANTGGFAAGGGQYSSEIFPSATGTGSVAIGGANCGASGQSAACIAGTGSSASNFYAFVTGDANTASGIGSAAFGQFNTSSGQDGFVSGNNSTDRGRYGAQVIASGPLSVQGDAQVARFVVRGTGASSGGTVNLTSDGNAAGAANCVNIPNNSTYAITATLVGIDHTTPANSWTASWGLTAAPHVMQRGANAASTLIDGVSTTIAADATRSQGTTTGIAGNIQADTTNGCLKFNITHPTNTDTWNFVAHVETVETQ